MNNFDKISTNTNNIKAVVDIFGSDVITLPVLPLRNLVAFPSMSLYLDVGRKKSIAAVNAAMKQNNYIFLVAQIDLLENDPESSNLYQVGTIAKVKQMLKLPGDEIRVALDGVCRASILSNMTDNGDYGEITIKCLREIPCYDTGDNKINALLRKLQSCFGELSSFVEKISPEVVMRVSSEQDGGVLADFITQNLFLKYQDKQDILACLDPQRRMEELILILTKETQILDIERQINGKVREKINKNQREYYIREQIKILQDEIGEGENLSAEADEYFDRIDVLAASDEIKKKLVKEAYRLLKMPYGSHESSVIRTYLDTCLELPWGKFTNDTIDIEKAQKILDKEHYGLTKVKERILETLAVKKLAADHKGQILCLIGPPGTGKTSIAQSIAKATHRKYVRVSLGGIHDESEIRGHRRTYIGAMPGKIIDAIKEAKSSNPVILLDEVDKLGNDYKGDSSSALLEVLDPEQNKNFKDHFIDIPFDLSNVLFIATANMQDTIPLPLLDRMDIIQLSSYTEEEKFHIAKKHLLPKELKKHGLTARTCKIEDDVIRDIIKSYTREAGVRKLERTIATLCRKVAKALVSDDKIKNVTIKASQLEKYLGPAKFKPEVLSKKDLVGVVTGLAYTSVGGEIMPIEVNVMEGTGKIELTGSLGEVMKESAHAGVSYIRSKAVELGIDPTFYKNKDIHIHIPEGAVPKDGPSAGITMATALISELTGLKVHHDLAMTGEITLRGRVLPIGGLKEKTMAAYKAGVKIVIIPKDNLSDLQEIDDVVKNNIQFVTAEEMREVLATALIKNPIETKELNIMPDMMISNPTQGIGIVQ